MVVLKNHLRLAEFKLLQLTRICHAKIDFDLDAFACLQQLRAECEMRCVTNVSGSAFGAVAICCSRGLFSIWARLLEFSRLRVLQTWDYNLLPMASLRACEARPQNPLSSKNPKILQAFTRTAFWAALEVGEAASRICDSNETPWAVSKLVTEF